MKNKIVLVASLFLMLTSCGDSKSTSSSVSSSDSPYSSSSTSSSSSEQSTTSTTSEEPPVNYLVTKYDFTNSENYASDSSVNFNHGTTVNGGSLSIEPNSWRSKNALSFSSTTKGSNYLEINHKLSSYSELTLSTWVYVPYPIQTFNNQSPLIGIKFENDDYFYSSPYDTDCWFGYSLNSKINGTLKQLTKVAPSQKTHWQNTPVDGTIQPLPGGWHLMTYEFSELGLSVFYNGKLMYSYEGNFSLSGKTISEFRIGSSTVGDALDFNGKISDFRAYSKLLSEKEIASEYNLTYEDFLTTNYTFNDTYADSVRNISATPNGNVSFVNKDGKDCVYLDGSGNAANNKSSITLSNQMLHGHNQITLSTDVYIENTGALYQRLFEFSIGGARFFSGYIGFAQTNNLKIEYAPDGDKKRDTLLDSAYVTPTDKWVNITVTADGEKGCLYVDGLLVASNDEFKYDPVICYYWPDMHCTLGRTDFFNDSPLKGYYDSFKMYSVALSEKDVMEINGLIKEKDDVKAVNNAINAFSFNYENELKVSTPKYADDGVRLTYQPADPSLMDRNGNLYPQDTASVGVMNVTFSRGDYSKTIPVNINIAARKYGNVIIDDVGLDQVTYSDDSYFDETMLSNIDYMFSLDTEKLLYNYRLNSKLDTKGATSYGGWIDTHTGGAGQFESQYVGALARYTLSKPNYVSSTTPNATNTPIKRLTYMLNEMRKCQVAYGELYPAEAGYLSAFTHLCMEAIEEGSSTVTGGDGIHGQVPIGGVNAWVPFYMYHKNLMMCYDVYTYVDDITVKKLALTMLKDAGVWVYNELSPLSESKRANVLNVEYGGMGEVMYLGYGVTKDYRFLNMAHFFEEESLLNDLYNNRNTLAYRHCNTTLPKILTCCAAYEVLGQARYRTIAENAWAMISEHMTYANGGVSLDELFEKEDITSQGPYGEETCCSYNMLRITDYLFRWSGQSKYFDYFENAFYNQIMCSIDPLTGGKTYPISTTFGYHKIYSSATNSFWCCCCTGQESFSKLTFGNFYKEKNSSNILVNLYNQTTYSDEDTTIGISGNLFIDEMVHLSVKSSKNFTLKLRVPSWCKSMSLELNGNPISANVENGYMLITRTWSETDDLLIKLPMDYRLDEQKGYEGNYALFYGPLMLVANLGESTPSSCIHDNQTASGTYGGQYSGPLTKFMYLSDGIENFKTHITRTVVSDKLKFSFVATNQTIEFIPFIDAIYNRFSMYMTYDFNYTPIIIGGERVDVNTSSSSNFISYKTSSSSTVSFSSSGVTMVSGEQKLMVNDANLTGDYEVGFTLAPSGENKNVNAGIYLGAKNVGSAQDKIDALNIHVEKASGGSTWSIFFFKFAQTYQGSIQNVTVNSTDTSLSLRVIVKSGTVYLFVGNNQFPITSCKIDSSWTNGQLGLRNQGNSSTVISSLYYIN